MNVHDQKLPFNQLVIIHSRLQGKEFEALRNQLSFTNYRYTSGNQFDFLFPTTRLSLAISIVENLSKNFEGVVNRINSIQRAKSNHFAVILCPNVHNALWSQLQLSIQPGDTRLIRVYHDSELAMVIESIIDAMSDTTKLQNQDQFIRNEEIRLASKDSSRALLSVAVGKLGLTATDETLLVEGLGSISNIMSASMESLEENCPIDITSIEKITQFFHAKSSIEVDDEM